MAQLLKICESEAVCSSESRWVFSPMDIRSDRFIVR